MDDSFKIIPYKYHSSRSSHKCYKKIIDNSDAVIIVTSDEYSYNKTLITKDKSYVFTYI